MENATKALIIAGGVLIAVLLATVAMAIFRGLSKDVSSIYDELEASDISEFNQKFLNYNGMTLNIQDVATIIHLAQDNNERGRLSIEVKVKVRIRK